MFCFGVKTFSSVKSISQKPPRLIKFGFSFIACLSLLSVSLKQANAQTNSPFVSVSEKSTKNYSYNKQLIALSESDIKNTCYGYAGVAIADSWQFHKDNTFTLTAKSSGSANVVNVVTGYWRINNNIVETRAMYRTTQKVGTEPETVDIDQQKYYQQFSKQGNVLVNVGSGLTYISCSSSL